MPAYQQQSNLISKEIKQAEAVLHGRRIIEGKIMQAEQELKSKQHKLEKLSGAKQYICQLKQQQSEASQYKQQQKQKCDDFAKEMKKKQIETYQNRIQQNQTNKQNYKQFKEQQEYYLKYKNYLEECERIQIINQKAQFEYNKLLQLKTILEKEDQQQKQFESMRQTALHKQLKIRNELIDKLEKEQVSQVKKHDYLEMVKQKRDLEEIRYNEMKNAELQQLK